MQNMSILALITARGGSKGIPRKNVLPLGDKPVIVWSIKAALTSRSVDRVIVSTDDEEIAAISREHGAEVPFLRPTELARDDTGHMDVVIHAIEWLEREQDYRPDLVLLLQPTSPLRTPEDIDAAAELIATRAADSVVSVCETHQHPHLIRKISEKGTLVDFVSGSPQPGSSERRRQDLPPAYFENGAIYLTKRSVLLERRTFVPENTVPYIMPAERSLQIDDAWDLRLIEMVVGGG